MAVWSGYSGSQFLAPGNSYIGFSFDIGAGSQYGWARLDMAGAPHNAFTVVDYAYADFGEAIAVGQVPAPGSLALLAIGAGGLFGWRRKRAA